MKNIPTGFNVFDWELGYSIQKTGSDPSIYEKCKWVPEIGNKVLYFSDYFVLNDFDRFEFDRDTL